MANELNLDKFNSFTQFSKLEHLELKFSRICDDIFYDFSVYKHLKKLILWNPVGSMIINNFKFGKELKEIIIHKNGNDK